MSGITRVVAVAIMALLSGMVLVQPGFANGLDKWLIYVLEVPELGVASYLLSVEGSSHGEYKTVDEGRPYLDEGNHAVVVIFASGNDNLKDYFCQVSYRATTPNTLAPLVPLPGLATESAAGPLDDRTATAHFRRQFSEKVWSKIKDR